MIRLNRLQFMVRIHLDSKKGNPLFYLKGTPWKWLKKHGLIQKATTPMSWHHELTDKGTHDMFIAIHEYRDLHHFVCFPPELSLE